MKTDETTINGLLKKTVPLVVVETLWDYDTYSPDLHEDCDGFENECHDDWQVWSSEVRATTIWGGVTVTGSAYLGGTWERAGDHPSQSNPEISGYRPQMVVEALEELARELGELGAVPACAQLRQINAALGLIK